jgi:hypothetical protein
MITLLMMLLLQSTILYGMQAEDVTQEMILYEAEPRIYDEESKNACVNNDLPELDPEIHAMIIDHCAARELIWIGSHKALSKGAIKKVANAHHDYILQKYILLKKSNQSDSIDSYLQLIHEALSFGNPSLKREYPRKNFESIWSDLRNLRKFVNGFIDRMKNDIYSAKYIVKTVKQAANFVALDYSESYIKTYYSMRLDFLDAIKKGFNRGIKNKLILINGIQAPLIALQCFLIYWAFDSSKIKNTWPLIYFNNYDFFLFFLMVGTCYWGYYYNQKFIKKLMKFGYYCNNSQRINAILDDTYSKIDIVKTLKFE